MGDDQNDDVNPKGSSKGISHSGGKPTEGACVGGCTLFWLIAFEFYKHMLLSYFNHLKYLKLEVWLIIFNFKTLKEEMNELTDPEASKHPNLIV